MTYMVIFFQISFSKFKTQIQGRRMGNTTTSASEKDNTATQMQLNILVSLMLI